MSQTAAATKNRITTKEMAMTALMAVLIAVCSWISIPAAVPFTLQTFGVACAVLILGGRNGCLAMIVYLLLGAVGLPVFSGFKSGIGVLLGTTGGYLIGYIFLTLIYWAAERIPTEKKTVRTAVSTAAVTAGLVICYAFGTVWFMIVYTRNTGSISIAQALKWCVIPFIPFDLLKIAAAVIVSGRVKRFYVK
ncbi:MAG: biotin transporter BioY [Ruminococcus sp.]|nr:biotin transporter BioY [Ruminococcus sp.]